MTEKKLLKILNELRTIEPDRDYTRKSRTLILLTHPKTASKTATIPTISIRTFIEFVRLTAVVAFGIVLILSIFSGASYINKNFSPIILSGLDQKSLLTEADEINNSIDVTLKEIRYLDSANSATNKQIEEVASNDRISSDLTPTNKNPNPRPDQKINDLLEKASQ